MCSMACVAIMACGTVINTVSFIGSNYLARYLSGDDPQAPLKEKKRHDKVIESYQAALHFCSTNLDLLNLTSISSNSFLNSFYSSQSLLVKNLCPHIPGRRALFSFGIAPWYDQKVCFALCVTNFYTENQKVLCHSTHRWLVILSRFRHFFVKQDFFPAAACSTGSPLSFFLPMTNIRMTTFWLLISSKWLRPAGSPHLLLLLFQLSRKLSFVLLRRHQALCMKMCIWCMTTHFWLQFLWHSPQFWRIWLLVAQWSLRFTTNNQKFKP